MGPGFGPRPGGSSGSGRAGRSGGWIGSMIWFLCLLMVGACRGRTRMIRIGRLDGWSPIPRSSSAIATRRVVSLCWFLAMGGVVASRLRVIGIMSWVLPIAALGLLQRARIILNSGSLLSRTCESSSSNLRWAWSYLDAFFFAEYRKRLLEFQKRTRKNAINKRTTKESNWVLYYIPFGARLEV